ncbi:MAG: PAS domain S-box protein [Actinomycetes bacterium]
MTLSSDDLVDSVLSLMPDAAIVIDSDGRILQVNWMTQQLFGYSPEEIVGKHVEVLVPERFRAGHRSHRRSYIESPHRRAMGVGLELFGRRIDGSEFAVDISLASIRIGDGLSVIASIRDVTDRRDAEAAQSRLAAIVESSADAIISTTAEGIVVSWNPGAERVLGYSAVDVVGVDVRTMIPEPGLVELNAQLSEVKSGQFAGPRDTEWRHRDGTMIPVVVVVSPMRSTNSGLVGYSVMVRDITERKRTENQLRELLVQGELQARWLTVMAQLRLELLASEVLEPVLELICESLCELLKVETAITAIGWPAEFVAGSGLTRPALNVGTKFAVPRSKQMPFIEVLADLDSALQGQFGSPRVLFVPINLEVGTAGFLICGIDEAPDETGMLIAISLADQAALGIELARARHDREQLLIGDERERIARDLHDLVIQRLFASGLILQGALPLVEDARATDRLSKVVDELDETIREIRTTIFTLAPPPIAAAGIRVELLRVLNDASRVLGFEPSMRFDGPIDSAANPVITPQILAVVHEGLSNVARHAHATSAAVEVSTDGKEFVVVIRDDGVGIGDIEGGSGLRNIRSRADELGGTFAIGPIDGVGTRIEWRVPVNESR